MSDSQGRTLGWLLVLLAVLAFAFQGTRGLWEPDEGRYTSGGVNMVRSGDWMVPTIDAEHPHLTKPPMAYWALAASFEALGMNEWAARLPAALAFVGTGLFVFGLGRRLCPGKPWLPAVVWSLSLAPLIGGNIVSTDALLGLFEAGAMFAFVEAWSRPAPESKPWWRLMWAIWGLAFMTKGPPGLLPLFGMVPFLYLTDRRRLRELLDPAGIALFAVIAASWFVVVILQEPARLKYFLGYEVYDRVFTAAHKRNSAWYGGFEIYVPVLLVGALPWSVLAVLAAGGPRTAWGRARERVRQRDPQWLLLLCWFAVPFAIFMLARSRLPLYVVPLFVPLALVFARLLANWAWLDARRLRMVAVATGVALLALKGTLAYWPSDKDSRAMAAAIGKIVGERPYDGIAFVEMAPFYGLNLYLDRPVKGVPLHADRAHLSVFAKGEDICTEFSRPRRTLFAVKKKNAPRLVTRMGTCGGKPVPLGEFFGDGNPIVLFAVQPHRLNVSE
jgi:4-amino-4-deoxy-L-arabinose transferase